MLFFSAKIVDNFRFYVTIGAVSMPRKRNIVDIFIIPQQCCDNMPAILLDFNRRTSSEVRFGRSKGTKG